MLLKALHIRILQQVAVLASEAFAKIPFGLSRFNLTKRPVPTDSFFRRNVFFRLPVYVIEWSPALGLTRMGRADTGEIPGTKKNSSTSLSLLVMSTQIRT